MNSSLAASLAVIITIAFLGAPLTAQEAGEHDPTKREVPLPARGGWHARLVLDNDVGVWTVGTLECYPGYGCPEIFGLDDRGRCIILSSYSGKWTPVRTTQDGAWLGALVVADVDPELPGEEIYTGGKNGNLYQLQAREFGGFDVRVMAHLRGEEIHTLVAGDLRPERTGAELLAFTRRGDVVELRPDGRTGRFEATVIDQLPGRVRQAVLLPAAEGERPWIAAVARFGEVLLLRVGESGLERRTLVREPMGFGRIALRPHRDGAATVLYVSRDDGVILKLERAGDAWKREVIYAGPQGPRGVAAGRFDADPDVETVAVFGYSTRVQLLSRRPGEGWKVETLFEDVDKGHWLATAELDGRNGTHELIGSGYGKRIFLLSRPPGYGIGPAPTDPDGPEEPGEPEPDEDGDAESADLRIALPADRAAVDGLSPLRYRGGFVTKSLVFDTLVKRDAAGRIAPSLASTWRHENGGRTWIFELDPGARFHDGTAVTADAVRLHFRRWIGLPEHGWIPASSLIRDVVADGPRTLRIELELPHALLPDLCAINPCSVAAPSTFDHEGEFERPVGSGPFAWEGTSGEGRCLLFRRGEARLVAHRMGRDAAIDPVEMLMAGRIDVVWDGWLYSIPRDRIAELRKHADLVVTESPGSSVRYLDFSFVGSTSDVRVRRGVRALVRRDELVETVESGLADPCTTWAAPSIAGWRASDTRGANEESHAVPAVDPLRVLVDARDDREVALGEALVAQLADGGLAAVVVPLRDAARARALRESDYDVRISRTWGLPYDPHLSLVARFLPESADGAAVTGRIGHAPAAITDLVRLALREPDERAREGTYARIQELLDRDAVVIPLYVPRRIAVTRRGLAPPGLGPDLYRVDLSPMLR